MDISKWLSMYVYRPVVTGVSDEGIPTYTTYDAIPCRVQYKDEVIYTENNEEYISEQQIISETPIYKYDRLWEIEASASSNLIEDLKIVKKVIKVYDKYKIKVLYKSYL